MNRWSAVALLLAVAAALALRFPKLDTRPLHNDEAVNAIKVAELWQHGRYKYDPDEYHGPTLHYATLPFLWLSGARNDGELKDAVLRFAPVAFGIGLILLLPLFANGLSRHALIWTAVFIAISPAMVFYSRYFIHEMLLVFFTALTIGAGWRYFEKCSPRVSLSPQRGEDRGERWERFRSVANESARQDHPSPLPVEGRGRSAARWASLAGAGLGLMFATKETFVLTVAAMGLAAAITFWRVTLKGNRLRSLRAFWNWKHAAFATGSLFVVWLLFFSSFFTNFPGLLDSALTYLPWLKRAGGHSPHIHPWHFYLERLAWFNPPKKGPVWSEGLILALALVGIVVAFVRKNPLHWFLALYTVILTGIYSVISYKTPWCLLNFYLGMILLAGIGAAAVVEFFRARALQAVAAAVLLALTAQLTWRSWNASVVYAADRRNPYVYAQTAPDLLNLVQRTEGIARVAPTKSETVVKVIATDGDYWPLPWYLRRFKHVGWYDKLPDDPLAPVIIVSSTLDARLDEKTEKKWLMVGLTELRPGKFFEQYVELELWKKYVETLPRERE